MRGGDNNTIFCQFFQKHTKNMFQGDPMGTPFMRYWSPLRTTLLAMIANSAVQPSIRTFFHNAILFIDTSNNA